MTVPEGEKGTIPIWKLNVVDYVSRLTFASWSLHTKAAS